MIAIHTIFKDSFESYGAPRIAKELLNKGYAVSRPRVARLIKAHGLFARKKRRFIFTTDSKHNYPVAPNIPHREFDVARENQVWVSDITYIETKQGWVYLTVIIDLFHRKIVGWLMSDNLSTQATIMTAWNMASKSNNITKERIFHSDRGSQYASCRFIDILKSYNGLVNKVGAERETARIIPQQNLSLRV